MIEGRYVLAFHATFSSTDMRLEQGISQNFLKVIALEHFTNLYPDVFQNQLFRPFCQENPLQTGTGLGLAIVNSIVRSESVNGKVDVWSEEGVGTEIKVTFMAETIADDKGSVDFGPMKFEDPQKPPTVSLVGFERALEGQRLLMEVLTTYLVSWWGFEIHPADDEGYGEIVIVNEDLSPVTSATATRDTSRPFIVLSASRGNPRLMSIASEHERVGGFCRILYKPGGPSRLRSVLKLCLHALKITRSAQQSRSTSSAGISSAGDGFMRIPEAIERRASPSSVARRNSDESYNSTHSRVLRPRMAPRSSTAHPLTSNLSVLSSTREKDGDFTRPQDPSSSNGNDAYTTPTISIGSGGVLLQSSIGVIDQVVHRFRVLVVEDNKILRNLLCDFFLHAVFLLLKFI